MDEVPVLDPQTWTQTLASPCVGRRTSALMTLGVRVLKEIQKILIRTTLGQPHVRMTLGSQC